jgi:DNA-binding transcriptional ArsR family regulator
MNTAARLDRSFAALADPTRRAIVQRLAAGETTVTELAKPFAISLPAISRHLRVLEAATLIRQERAGRFRRCRLDPDGLKSAVAWLDFYRHFWSESFERLDEHLKTAVRPSASAKAKGGSGAKAKARSKR